MRFIYARHLAIGIATTLAIVAMATSLNAQARKMVDITDTAPGQYLLTVSASGVSLVPVTVLVPGGGSPPVPPPPVPTGIAAQVRAIVQGRDKAIAEQFSVRWAGIAALGQQGVLATPKQMSDGINGVVDQYLGTLPDGAEKSAWSSATDKIFAVVRAAEAALFDSGKQPVLADYVGWFKSVAEGLTTTEGVADFGFVSLRDLSRGQLSINDGAAKAINWTELLKIVMQIIQLLKDLGILGAQGVSLDAVPVQPLYVSRPTRAGLVLSMAERGGR